MNRPRNTILYPRNYFISNFFPKFLIERSKIKFLNGKTFIGLTKLRDVSLDSSVCISARFRNPTAIQAMYSEIDAKCAFDEDMERSKDEIRRLWKKIEKLHEELEKKSKHIKELQGN